MVKQSHAPLVQEFIYRIHNRQMGPEGVRAHMCNPRVDSYLVHLLRAITAYELWRKQEHYTTFIPGIDAYGWVGLPLPPPFHTPRFSQSHCCVSMHMLGVLRDSTGSMQSSAQVCVKGRKMGGGPGGVGGRVSGRRARWGGGGGRLNSMSEWSST